MEAIVSRGFQTTEPIVIHRIFSNRRSTHSSLGTNDEYQYLHRI
ncbi:hypothetical protein RSSM_00268 [Rhodopirellula sallentina SM41]|uniref:Uncharacterized protein n=1 Tax=Rhodopirellula sallentina SM41 TaxID=1263870 RepID=M5UAG3_9BACT|nr:hypothetical protein RSSM_00268 [Rhodopirellula sallentina SM41]